MPNVRLRLVTILPQLRATLTLPEDNELLSLIEAAIKDLLVTEVDRDVLAALQVNCWIINSDFQNSESTSLLEI